MRSIICLAAVSSVLLAVPAPGSILSAEQPARTGKIRLTPEEFERALSEIESPLVFQFESLAYNSSGTVTLETEVLADRVELRDTWELECRGETIKIIQEETIRKDFLLTLVAYQVSVTTSNSECVCDVCPLDAALFREDDQWKWTLNGEETQVPELHQLPAEVTTFEAIFRLASLLPCEFSEEIPLAFLPLFTASYQIGKLGCEKFSEPNGVSRRCILQESGRERVRLEFKDCNELVEIAYDRKILRRIPARGEP